MSLLGAHPFCNHTGQLFCSLFCSINNFGGVLPSKTSTENCID